MAWLDAVTRHRFFPELWAIRTKPDERHATVKIALEVWGSSYEQVESTCLLAESLGLDGFYYGEAPHDLNLDCWTTLAGLARASKRIRLGPVITNILPSYRSHVLLAKQAATVAAISDGRLDFRTGVGASTRFGRPWWEPFGVAYPDYELRLTYLQNALVALPRLWAGESLNTESVAPRGLTSPHHIPVTIAASGDRAMAFTAAHADVWETSFCTPAEFAERAARLTDLCGGRHIVRSLEIDGFVSRSASGLGRLLDRFHSQRGTDEDTDHLLERALVGAPDDAAAQLTLLEAAGVDQVVVALHDPHDPDAVEAIAAAAACLHATAGPSNSSQ